MAAVPVAAPVPRAVPKGTTPRPVTAYPPAPRKKVRRWPFVVAIVLAGAIGIGGAAYGTYVYDLYTRPPSQASLAAAPVALSVMAPQPQPAAAAPVAAPIEPEPAAAAAPVAPTLPEPSTAPADPASAAPAAAATEHKSRAKKSKRVSAKRASKKRHAKSAADDEPVVTDEPEPAAAPAPAPAPPPPPPAPSKPPRQAADTENPL